MVVSPLQSKERQNQSWNTDLTDFADFTDGILAERDTVHELDARSVTSPKAPRWRGRRCRGQC